LKKKKGFIDAGKLMFKMSEEFGREVSLKFFSDKDIEKL